MVTIRVGRVLRGSNSPRLLVIWLVLLGMFAASTLLAPAVNAAAGDGGFTPHPALVPESPETGYPILLDTPTYISQSPNCPNGCTNHRQTYAVDMVGQYIISGGDFMNIELQNGNTISQPYLAIVDSTTKQLVCSDLDVNNEVLAIAPGPLPRTAIIGGRFTVVNGADGVNRSKSHLAMIHLDTCQVDTMWSGGSLDSKVTEIAVSGNRLFVGGDFNQVAGNNIEKLAELDYSTGAVNTNFSFTFAGELGRAIVGLEASPDGTRLAIVHRATSIDGQSMRGSAVFNIANPSAPTLTNHRMSTGVKAYSHYFDIQKGAVSPDFSRLGIVQGTATSSDYVTLLPTAEASAQLSWQHFMRDSSFGIGISNNAVYVGGHFCKIDAGPGPTQTLSPNSGPSTCTGTRKFEGGAWRTQLAALDIGDGTPLNWNPGNDAGRGATALTVVSRGLLIGFDGDVTNNIRTGTTAFFDFGAPDDPRADQTCTAVVNGLDVDLTWDAVPGVNSYNLRRNAAAIASPGNVLSFTDTPPTGTHNYYIRTDLDGAQWDTTCSPTVTVGPPAPSQTCQATDNGDGSITLDWTAIPGENNYIIRRNGSWLTTPGNALTFTESPGNGTYNYVIRSSINGTTTNTTCNPTITIDGGNPGAQTCQATDNGDGSITLDWTAIPGENNYIIRRNGSWLTTPGNALTFTESPGNGTYNYVIRSSINGTTTNTTCNPTITIDGGNPGAQTCALTVVGGDAVLTWTTIPGENNYIVRRNGSWLTTPGNALTFTDTTYSAGDSYIIRSRIAGVTTNTSCA